MQDNFIASFAPTHISLFSQHAKLCIAKKKKIRLCLADTVEIYKYVNFIVDLKISRKYLESIKIRIPKI